MRRRCRAARAVMLSAVLALAGTAAAQTVKTVVGNGATSNRYDVVILGDGYRALEEARFDSDVLTFVTALFNKEPYRTFGAYFNVHTVFRASNESGADHPDASPPIVRDTVYDASYNTGGTARCLYIKNTSLALADAALAPANEGRVLVLVNDSRYGGCAGTFAVSYNGVSMTEVQIHEMGHSVGGLADEYGGPGTYSGAEPGQVNATKDAAGGKWSHWHGFDGISAFQGCRYYDFGLYRPRGNCLMRSLSQPHCAVCGEALVLETHRHASAIDDPQPVSSSVTVIKPATQAFSFTDIAPAASNAQITWRLDGVVQPVTGTSLTLQSSTLSAATHVLEVEVLDRNPQVRLDPAALLRQKRVWSVRVIDSPLPDLQVAAVTPDATTIQAGAAFGITTTVRNAGNGAAPTHAVAHLLSTDPNIDVFDVFLGTFQQSPLAASSDDTTQRAGVQMPAFVRPGTYYLAAFADWGGAVGEAVEGNNYTTTQVQVTRAACGAVLEYRDQELYPKDAAVLNMETVVLFDVVYPTITSPCDAGDLYVIVWGCSGTSPGTPLAPGLTLPLNLDGCSTLSLNLINSRYFQAFSATLDADGIGRASFLLPGVAYRGDVPGHFAGLLLDGQTFAFKAVTNPVGILLAR